MNRHCSAFHKDGMETWRRNGSSEIFDKWTFGIRGSPTRKHVPPSPDGEAAASVSAAWSGWSRGIRAGRCELLTMLKSSSRGSFSDGMKALATRDAKWELASCRVNDHLIDGCLKKLVV